MKRLVVIIIIVFGYSFSQSQKPIVANAGKQAKIVGLTYAVFTNYSDANSVNAIESIADNLIAEKLKNKTALPN